MRITECQIVKKVWSKATKYSFLKSMQQTSPENARNQATTTSTICNLSDQIKEYQNFKHMENYIINNPSTAINRLLLPSFWTYTSNIQLSINMISEHWLKSRNILLIKQMHHASVCILLHEKLTMSACWYHFMCIDDLPTAQAKKNQKWNL